MLELIFFRFLSAPINFFFRFLSDLIGLFDYKRKNFVSSYNLKFDKFNDLKRQEVNARQQKDLVRDLGALEAHSHHQLNL